MGTALSPKRINQNIKVTNNKFRGRFLNLIERSFQ